MKKTKLIALTMVVAIMMMGAGYAIWSDQVFLTTTVRTGEFDMQIVELSTRTGDDELNNEFQVVHNPKNTGFHQYAWTSDGDDWNTKILNPTEAIVELKDLYPGGVVQVDMKMKNEGTIPARLKSITVVPLKNQALFDLLRARTSWMADIDGDGERDDMSIYNWGHVEWDRETWRLLPGALDALVKNLDSYNIVIEPGGYLSLGDGTQDGCINFKLDPSAGNEFQNQMVQFKIIFNWEQWSTDPVANPYFDDFYNDGYGGDGKIEGIYQKPVE